MLGLSRSVACLASRSLLRCLRASRAPAPLAPAVLRPRPPRPALASGLRLQASLHSVTVQEPETMADITYL